MFLVKVGCLAGLRAVFRALLVADLAAFLLAPIFTPVAALLPRGGDRHRDHRDRD
jgi:hypothetical protein